jgi:hypothetical protein
LNSFLIFLRSFTQIQAQYLKPGYERFLPHSLQLITRDSSYH